MADVPEASRLDDLRGELDAVLTDAAVSEPASHPRLHTLACAIISEALRRHGMEATLVGGGAIEFHAPGVYFTDDLDLVVEPRTVTPHRTLLTAVFTTLGFIESGRHWVRGGLFVEVPGSYLEDPFEEYPVGPYTLRVVKKEAVLVGRLVELDQTGHTGMVLRPLPCCRYSQGNSTSRCSPHCCAGNVLERCMKRFVRSPTPEEGLQMQCCVTSGISFVDGDRRSPKMNSRGRTECRTRTGT